MLAISAFSAELPVTFCRLISLAGVWLAFTAANAGDITASSCTAALDPLRSDKPNIVFVLFDDLGWGQPQSYNAASKLRTPNLDRLASQGMRFTDAHSASAVCTPTRYGILTGRYPWRIGQFGVCTTYSPPIIPSSRLTVASLLKQHGYRTACVGKWHLGLNWVDGRPGKEDRVPIGAKLTDGPNALGFDYFCGFTHARNIGTIIEQDQVVAHVAAEENQPLMISKAIAWLDQQTSQQPFFLYFPMCPPHTPVAPSDDYQGQSGATDVVGKDPNYGDWLFQGDAMLGQLIDNLTTRGLIENTLIIATSDNGAAGRSYAPLRAAKASIYEGGHRVPFVASWPEKISPGTENHQTICLIDLIATVADVLDATVPADAAEDSFSLLPCLLGTGSKTETPVRRTTIHQSHKKDIAIRQGPWKMIFLNDGRRELFHLADDLSETTNVLPQYPDHAAELIQELQSQIDSGRSTTGPPQSREFQYVLPEQAQKEKQAQKKTVREKSQKIRKDDR